MVDLKTNPLLWVTILVGAGYWVLAPLAGNPLLSIVMALAVMITSAVALAEYTPEAWRVVVKKKRSSDEFGRGRGSHLAIFGFFMFALGSVFSGTYALAWSWLGQPTDWIGSASANFGRFCHAAGFVLMQAGPAFQKDGIVLTRSWWVTVIGAAALILIGFYLGMQVRLVETTEPLLIPRSLGYEQQAISRSMLVATSGRAPAAVA
ncbi:hypothetical protein [Rhizobium sp. SSA_523]|uniref:hypothetical protein n=1 Tax=Rhizobium sp. SSA_523 TaxID=2952477 RepID=UPI002090010B|nr:hypothetical protein [Rhizobium sp. SSA_523]MCO5730060.1 hypothetical protein [Rhizobium sp. SSA_523]WKC25126.1 hypothetical protein QTJ18_14150 [Rhizobium sp. SSA_523]